jgi:hypothetical protein
MFEEHFDPKIKIFDGQFQKLYYYFNNFQVILKINYQLKFRPKHLHQKHGGAEKCKKVSSII